MTAVLYRARRISAADLGRKLAVPAALDDADAIRAEAKAFAAQVLADAHSQAQALLAAAQNDASALAQAEGEAERGRIDAHTIRDVIAAAGQIEARFDAMTPWLEALVGQIVTRIIGSFTLEETHRRLLEEALATSRPSGSLRLRVSPENLAAAVTGCAAVTTACPVLADASLPGGSCILDCDGGLLDLSVSAQVDAVLKALSASLPGAQP